MLTSVYSVCGSSLRLVEVAKVMEGHRSMELEEFMAGVGDQLDQTNETLGQWFTQIQTIFYKVMKKDKKETFSFSFHKYIFKYRW